MKSTRTPRYIGTLPINGKEYIVLSALREYLKGSDYRLSLHGRGPRKHLCKIYGRSSLRSNLCLGEAKSVDIYLRPKEGEFPYNHNPNSGLVRTVAKMIKQMKQMKEAIEGRNDYV